MSIPLKRKVLLWRDAAARAAEVRKRAAQARTGQVVRSTIDVGENTVSMDEALVGGVEAGELSAEQQETIDLIDQDQADSVDFFLDGTGLDIEDQIDAAELVDESIQADADRWEEAADAEQTAHDATMQAIANNLAVDQAREVADTAMEKASQSTETALGNARYRQVDGGEIFPELPPDGPRVGAELIQVNELGRSYKVEVWNGTAWAHAQYLADELLVPGENGTVRLKDGQVTAEMMAASFYYGREFYGGMFEQQGKSSPAGTYPRPVTENSRFQWMAYEGVNSLASYAVSPPVYSLDRDGAPVPPAAVIAAGNTSCVGGTRHSSDPTNEINTRWMVPDEFDGATADLSFYVYTPNAGQVSIVGGTPKSANANQWTKLEAKNMALTAGALIGFEVVTAAASRPLFVTAPEVIVRVPGELRARLSTEDGVSGLRFARGTNTVGKYTGNQVDLSQAGTSTRRILVTPNGVSFSDRNSDGTVNLSRFKTIRADGSLVIAAPRLVLHGDVSFASVPKFPGDYGRDGLPGTVEPGFTVFASESVVRAGMVTLSLNIQGPITQGAGLTVWKNFRPAWRPTVNQQAAAWLDGGYAGVAWLRPDGTIAVANRSGATRNSAQFTIVYPLPDPPA